MKEHNVQVTGTISVGDLFKIVGFHGGFPGYTCLLAQVEPSLLVLINLNTGNRWSYPVYVLDISNVTVEEFKMVLGKIPVKLCERVTKDDEMKTPISTTQTEECKNMTSNHPLFEKALKEMGFAGSRIKSLSESIAAVHSAICELDSRNLSIVWGNGGISGLISTFATSEHLRDVYTK